VNKIHAFVGFIHRMASAPSGASICPSLFAVFSLPQGTLIMQEGVMTQFLSLTSLANTDATDAA
jgi:hypothetical protein